VRSYQRQNEGVEKEEANVNKNEEINKCCRVAHVCGLDEHRVVFVGEQYKEPQEGRPDVVKCPDPHRLL